MSPYSFLNIDFEKLFKPIKGKNPSGQFLNYETEYDQIKEARYGEDEHLPQGVWEHDLKKADWKLVQKVSVAALSKKTKDLQISTWLTESWIHLHGLKGFAAGLHVTGKLLSEFWDTVYPPIPDGDIEYRISPLIWINEKLSAELKLIQVTAPRDHQYQNFRFADWENANYLNNLSKQGQEGAKAYQNAKNDGQTTAEDFKHSQNSTSTDFYKDLLSHTQMALDETSKINRFISQQCPGYPSILNQVNLFLSEIEYFTKKVLSERGKLMPESSLEISENSTIPQDRVLVKLPTSALNSRQEAYQRLEEIANYLTTIEPHSPTPYLIKRAISWGHMSLMEVLEEIIHDKNGLQGIMKILGVQDGMVTSALKANEQKPAVPPLHQTQQKK